MIMGVNLYLLMEIHMRIICAKGFKVGDFFPVETGMKGNIPPMILRSGDRGNIFRLADSPILTILFNFYI